ncbi:hypothetical protein D3C79_948880 [compost metagenome]
MQQAQLVLAALLGADLVDHQQIQAAKVDRHVAVGVARAGHHRGAGDTHDVSGRDDQCTAVVGHHSADDRAGQVSLPAADIPSKEERTTSPEVGWELLGIGTTLGQSLLLRLLLGAIAVEGSRGEARSDSSAD